jgi:SagB-type dehydrogenase family enzyme
MPDGNRDTRATWMFHNATKYGVVRDANGNERDVMGTPPDVEDPIWQQDWSLEPFPFKIYETLPPLTLPRTFAPSALPGLEALARTGVEPRGEAVPDRAALARLALLSNGLLDRRVTSPRGRTIEFRTAASTGARYHLELYFICADLPELEAGVYHYAAHDHSLRQLRSGDFRAELVAATGGDPALSEAPVVLAMTSTFWRNAWRYKARAYRHTFWDAGTSLAQALAVAASLALPTQVNLGYADAAVNALLGVDGEREATVVLCALGRRKGTGSAVPAARALEPLDYPTRVISPREVTFTAIPAMHVASTLASGTEAAAWRAAPLRRVPPEPHGPLLPLQPLSAESIPSAPIEDIIMGRRSTRHYDRATPISFTAFSTLLAHASHGFAADCLDRSALSLHDLYLIVNHVEGIAPGIYLHHPQRQAVELLKEGDFRAQAQRLAFDQDYAGDAHVNCYYLTDLRPVLERYGNRGYRLAQLECSLAAGKVHLGSHALGLRAVGSTSRDDEVVAFFSPHAADKSYMFVTVFGKRRSPAVGANPSA